MKEKAKFDAGTSAGSAGTEIDAYTYLRRVWNDEMQPAHVRMRAAQVGIEYERPRLAVTAVVEDRGFAALLDQRLQRIRESKLIEVKPINGDEGLASKQHSAEELKGSEPVPDRRFRKRV